MLEINLLGELEVLSSGRDIAPSAPRIRAVLALLALNVGRAVSTEALFEELWDDRPPRSAATTLQTYVYQLRRILNEASKDGSTCCITTRQPGYMLRLANGRVDADVFLGMSDEGRDLWRLKRPEEAAERLQQALVLWRGPVLSGIRVGPRLTIHTAHLSEARLRAIEMRIHAYAMLGRHYELIPELRSLVAEHRLNEKFHAQLIASLHYVGRRADALEAYQALRRMLNTELGLDPTPDIQQLHAELLTGNGGSVTAGRSALDRLGMDGAS